jgi:hypothetical protein
MTSTRRSNWSSLRSWYRIFMSAFGPLFRRFLSRNLSPGLSFRPASTLRQPVHKVTIGGLPLREGKPEEISSRISRLVAMVLCIASQPSARPGSSPSSSSHPSQRSKSDGRRGHRETWRIAVGRLEAMSVCGKPMGNSKITAELRKCRDALRSLSLRFSMITSIIPQEWPRDM